MSATYEMLQVPKLEWLDATHRDGAWSLRIDGEWRPLRDAQGQPVHNFQPGWSVDSALRFGDQFVLVCLRHENQTQAAWLMDGDLKYLIDPAFPNVASAIKQRVCDALVPMMRVLLADATVGLTVPSIVALTKLDRQHLRVLLAMLTTEGLGLEGRPIDPGKSSDVTSMDGPISIPLSRAMDQYRLPYGNTRKIMSDNAVVIPSLISDENLADISLVPILQTTNAFFCAEGGGKLKYIIFRGRLLDSQLHLEATVFPKDWCYFFRQSPHDGGYPFDLGRCLISLFGQLLETGPAFGPWLALKNKNLALLSFGLVHLGHALWEEFPMIQRVLEALPADRQTPMLYVQTANTGIDVYGPFEDLFPEFRGRTVRADSLQELVTHGVAAGVQLFWAFMPPRYAVVANRPRIQSLIAHHAETHDMQESARNNGLWNVSDAEVRLGITLQLRLFNRAPEDFFGFYVWLTETLVRRFGPLRIVIDGMNREAGAKETTARLYSAPVGQAQAQTPLDGELEFADKYIERVKDLPVQVVNCVGTPIRDNLYWLDRTDYFVAPVGAGLAKLRWALDKPGFVLTSRLNIFYCSLQHAYDAAEFMELPCSELTFNAPEDVVDRIVTPQETYEQKLIPYGESFALDEMKIALKIVEAIERSLEANRVTPG